MKRIKVNIPQGSSGSWHIRTATGDESTIYTDAAGFPVAGRAEPYGEYTFLFHNNFGLVMQDTFHEYEEHQSLWEAATGDVLIGGLGIGLVNHELIQNPNITSVTIIEKNQEVIDLVWEHCPKDERFSVICADIFSWNPPSGQTWDCGWFDTLSNEFFIEQEVQNQIEEDVISLYDELIREKYQNLCNWIDVWRPLP